MRDTRTLGMRLAQLLAPVLGALVAGMVLAGCGSTPAPAPAPAATATPIRPAPQTSRAARATTARASFNLPPAPAPEQWVKSTKPVAVLDADLLRRLQQVVGRSRATRDTARALAYHVCQRARSGMAVENQGPEVQNLLDIADIDAPSLLVAAQKYCLDTVT